MCNRENTGAARAVYRQAVERLLEAAGHSGTSGGKAAAQVLLNLYNGFEFHTDLTDLVYLDREHFTAALTAIELRIATMTEPHSVIADGDARFRALWDEWAHLHVKRRYRKRRP